MGNENEDMGSDTTFWVLPMCLLAFFMNGRIHQSMQDPDLEDQATHKVTRDSQRCWYLYDFSHSVSCASSPFPSSPQVLIH